MRCTRKHQPLTLLSSNYRPISLLSTTSKLLERIVHKRVLEHITPHLPNHQSGFRPGDGTVHQLSRLVHEISRSLDGSNAVVACFFDLSKAFDRVWHRGLLHKLEHLGIRGQLLAWFKSYLIGRRQRVQVGSSFSTWQEIPAGVPQGSVLGPLLFLIYTIDLPASSIRPGVSCSQFADDTALISTASSSATATTNLQESVNAASDWLLKWHLMVNASKTVTMKFSGREGLNNATQLPVQLNGTQLRTVQMHRHLGLEIQCDLRWGAHIQSKINSSSKLLFLVRRLRSSLTSRALALIYTTYIRPKLEYASVVYSSLSQKLSDQLERFQRRVARICLGMPLFNPTNHTALLHKLEWSTLSSRRQVSRLVFAHRLLNRNVPPHLITLIPPRPSRPSQMLRHSRVFSLPTVRTSRQRDSPINLSCHDFNGLPSSVSAIPSISEFKKQMLPLIESSVCTCSNHPPVQSFRV